MRLSPLSSLAERIDRRVGWYRLPVYPGIATLIGLRERLRERNLIDTGVPAATADELATTRSERVIYVRQPNGSHNDLAQPRMGTAGASFGRNMPAFPVDDAHVLGPPDPARVSEELLARERFLPAASLNMLAAAWLQFEVHDWMSHDKEDPADASRWHVAGQSDGTPAFGVPRAKRAPGSSSDRPAYTSTETHWWDASQLYGRNDDYRRRLRAGDDGTILTDADLLVAMEERTKAGDPAANMWIGLALMHILFAREHNAICRRLHEVYPRWPGRRVYETARLINAALMAKIHTVDWTPAVIAHPTTVRAIGVTWSGLLGERFRRRFGRIGRGELLSGVPGSRTDLYGVPYALTEEFVTVYRMHPLIPDHFAFRSCADDTPVEGANGERELGFGELAVGPHDLDRPRAHLEAIGLANALYSLGTSLPGQITLHNFPQALREFTTLDGRRIDLAAIDIVRARECAVPRYNDFRRQLRLAPAASFADLTDDPAWAAQIREVYENDIEAVDTMVGLFGEPKPPGFAFSDTAFRIFLLMATRRLQSDRFFTRDFTPETYTPVGLRWIADNRMIDVLARHFGELAPALRTVGNPFQPWGRVWARG